MGRSWVGKRRVSMFASTSRGGRGSRARRIGLTISSSFFCLLCFFSWAQLRRTEGWASLQYLALLRTNLTISGSSPSIPVNLDLTQAHSFAIIPKAHPVETAVRWHTGDIYAYSDFQASSAGFPSKLAGCVEELEVGEYWLMVRGLYETSESSLLDFVKI